MRRFVASLMVFGLLTCTAVFAQKEKEKDSLKDQWPKIMDGTVVKIVSVDVDKKTLNAEDGSGKKLTLAVTADTKFFGPQGGRSEEKIKDDRFVAGYTAKVITDKAGKNLTEVYLAYRIKKDEPKKPEEKKAEEKKKPDDKKKAEESKKK